MSTLHTVNKSPFEKETLESCLRYAKPGSALLFLEDGIYAALKGTAFEKRISTISDEISLYCLKSDIQARGFTENQMIDGIGLVDYGGFVELAATHDRVQAWF